MPSTIFDTPADASYDPLECLSRPNFDASDPPPILRFVYRAICASFDQLTAGNILCDMIQGDHSVADIWILWRPGDEEWLRSNLRRAENDGWLTMSAWELARAAYGQRGHRLVGCGVTDLWPALVKERIWDADTPTRASAIAWLTIISPFLARLRQSVGWLNFHNCIDAWIRVLRCFKLFVSLGFPTQPLAGFVEALPDNGHTCSFWDSPASSWATLFSWLYNYHDYRILVALCNKRGFVPSDKERWTPCDPCRSAREGLPSGPLPWVLDSNVRQNQPPAWQILLLMGFHLTIRDDWSNANLRRIWRALQRSTILLDDPLLAKYYTVIEHEFQNQEIHPHDRQYDTYVNQFPAEWRPIVSSLSWTLPLPSETMNVTPVIHDLGQPQGDLRTIVGAILMVWVDEWRQSLPPESPLATCDQIFKWCHLLFDIILSAFPISDFAPCNSSNHTFLDVLRKSRHNCYNALSDDAWTLYAASKSLVDKTDNVKVPNMNLHLSQDVRYNQHICPECRDIEYMTLCQTADPDRLIHEGKPGTLTTLRIVVDMLCDPYWTMPRRNEHWRWLLDLLQRFLDRPWNSWASDGTNTAEIIAQQENSTYKSTIHRLVEKLARVSGLLPTSISLQGVVTLTEGGLVAGGGYADIYAGFWKGRKVAIKRLRLHVAPLCERENLKQVRSLHP
ncbi:hypothetical protein JAAARDRAFT_192993 [Jaapia argillacea MUCL 33604]|uniref:Protein kinase domain-containing protein n=1 Tax=Jaapia argillacea MUCL 33604 TaxID=933084 RepID=A0A067PX57_9AGAM|nr:hypothetical protein JAAARDRAFT_192993 [Jaapia argillacea MUCL 33604]